MTRVRTIIVFGLSLVTLAACSDSATAPTPETAQFVAGAGALQGRPRFIVTVRDGANPADIARGHGVQPDFVYTHALNGFAGSMSDAARDGLLADSRVARVELDGVMEAWGTQTSATWGLDRIDQTGLPLSGSFTFSRTGAGVTAYIIDTGIRFDHSEFGGRATSGYDAVDLGTPADDCNGHGTHVAGTVGGTTYGVAKGVTLIAVRVLNCSGSGTTAGVIAGIDWVTSHHVAGAPAVANMSLGGGTSASLDAAVTTAIADGVSFAVAAGNGNQGGVAQDACKSSPARVAAALTISATNETDTKPAWANYGSCVDWFAPGVNITSAWHTGATAINTISGTSMATPHTAGVVALYLQGNPSAAPAAVRSALLAGATKGVVKSAKTTNNHLLFTNY
jgi:subtilisin family serine protease